MHPLFVSEIASEVVADRVRAADASRVGSESRVRRSPVRRAAGAVLVGVGMRVAGGSSFSVHRPAR